MDNDLPPNPTEVDWEKMTCRARAYAWLVIFQEGWERLPFHAGSIFYIPKGDAVRIETPTDPGPGPSASCFVVQRAIKTDLGETLAEISRVYGVEAQQMVSRIIIGLDGSGVPAPSLLKIRKLLDALEKVLPTIRARAEHDPDWTALADAYQDLR